MESERPNKMHIMNRAFNIKRKFNCIEGKGVEDRPIATRAILDTTISNTSGSMLLDPQEE